MIEIRLNKEIYKHLKEELPEVLEAAGSKQEAEEDQVAVLHIPGSKEDLEGLLRNLSYLDADD